MLKIDDLLAYHACGYDEQGFVALQFGISKLSQNFCLNLFGGCGDDNLIHIGIHTFSDIMQDIGFSGLHFNGNVCSGFGCE